MTDNVQKPNTFFIDDREVEIRDGETIFRAARRLDIRLPHLCYSPAPGYRPDGNCRVCMVEIEGERTLAASCIRKPVANMKVQTASARAKSARKLVFELLMADQPAKQDAHDPDSKFWQWAERVEVASSKSNTILAPWPRWAMPITSLTCTSRQARTQRLQWMQASRLTRIAG